MAVELRYESQIDLRQLPKLDVGDSGPILIVRPVTPRWWYLCFLVFWIFQFCALCALSVAFIRVSRSFSSRAGGLPQGVKLLLIGQVAIIALWQLISVYLGAWSFRQYQMALTPRRLWISNGAIHLNCASKWQVSTKTRDLRSIREVNLKPIKGFTGGTAGATLRVRFGRFRCWDFPFKQNQMPIAIEAQQLFARCLEHISKAKPERTCIEHDGPAHG